MQNFAWNLVKPQKTGFCVAVYATHTPAEGYRCAQIDAVGIIDVMVTRISISTNEWADIRRRFAAGTPSTNDDPCAGFVEGDHARARVQAERRAGVEQGAPH